ncbi:MAG: hypothetical protein ACJ79Y_19700 [Myxococcales bacterium]
MLALVVAAQIAAPVQIHAEPRSLELTGEAIHAVLHVRSPVEPRLSASAGTIANLRRETGDAWVADYLPPRGKSPQVAVVAAVAEGRLSWTTLRMGHPIDTPRLHVVLLEDRVSADRVEEVHVRILAADQAGKRLSRPKLVVQVGRGTLSPFERHGAGEMWATWTIPPGAAGSIRLRALLEHLPNLVAEASIEAAAPPDAVVATAPSPVVPQAVLSARYPSVAPRSGPGIAAAFAIGPAVGVTSNLARLTSPVAALSTSWRSDRLGPELALTGEVAWSFVSRKQSVGQFGTAQIRQDFFELAAQVAYRKRLGLGTTVWGGAGPSLQIVSGTSQMTGQPRISESALAPGGIFSLGIEHRFASTVPFAEARFAIHRNPELSSSSGAQSAFSFVVGTHFELL